MDFSFSVNQQRINDEVAAIGRSLSMSDLARREKNYRFSKPLFKQLAQSGINDWLFPVSQGGRGFNAVDLSIALEALGRSCEDSGLVFATAAHLCACMHPLVHYAETDLLKEWCQRIRTHHLLGAHAITEPTAGSDVFAMKCFAQKQGDQFILNGEKCYITNAPVADFLIVHCKTANQGNFFDFSCFLVDARLPGITISKEPFEKVGLRTAEMGNVQFDEVVLSPASLIGTQGGGAAIFQASIQWERTCLFAFYLGVLNNQLDQVVSRCEQRHQFGEPIIEHQAVAHALVDMYARYEASRLMVYRAAWGLDQGEMNTPYAALAKLSVSQTLIQNGLSALELHGASGMLSGIVEKQFRDALPATVFSGSSATMKNNLIKQLRRHSGRTKRKLAA